MRVFRLPPLRGRLDTEGETAICEGLKSLLEIILKLYFQSFYVKLLFPFFVIADIVECQPFQLFPSLDNRIGK